MFPQRLDSTLACAIAKAMMDGFNRHHRLFRTESARAQHRFETRDWLWQQRAHLQNDFTSVRRAVSTEYMENDEPSAKPTHRCCYPSTCSTLPFGHRTRSASPPAMFDVFPHERERRFLSHALA